MRLLIIICLFFLAACGESKDVDFNFKYNAKNQDELKKIEGSSAVLFNKCQALKDYRADIIEHEIVIRDAQGYSENRDFGWKDFVEYHLEVKEQTSVIPEKFYAAGHRCLYRINGDELVTQKTVCAFLCVGKEAQVDSTYSLYFGKSALPKRKPL